MTVETLEIRFNADLEPLKKQLESMLGQLQDMRRKALDVGNDFSKGFAGGITMAQGQVTGTAMHPGNTVTYGFDDRDAWNRNGFETQGTLLRAYGLAQEAAGGMEERIGHAVEKAVGEKNLSVVINVDGMRLGEAAIRGINQVTKATGKMQLEI